MPRAHRHVQPIYEETSRVRNSPYARVGFAIAVVAAAAVVSALAVDPDGAGLPVTIVSVIVMAVSLVPLLFERRTRVDVEAIRLKFDWVNRGKMDLPIQDIREHRVADRPPQTEWSQEAKQDATKVRVFWAQADRGVMLTVEEGRRIFIASSHPNRLNRAIARAIRRHRGIQ